jgi:16S rRNA processing protein RimM
MSDPRPAPTPDDDGRSLDARADSSAAAGASPPPLRLGLIGRAHGLGGAFRVVGAAEWYTFAPGATLLLDGEERELLTVAGTQQSPILELSGMGSREDAAAVLGHALELRASDAPAPEEDAFWVRDLVGLRARCGDRELGRVSDVLERPANDVLVLRLTDGREHLVPFTREAVPGIDVPGGVLELAEAFADPLDE